MPSAKKRGTTFDVRVSSTAGQANIHSVAVSLPKQLPARLTTIQKACRDTVFNANPAACPTGSLVGIAVASSPVLPVKLSGPAYLVSHGGAAFPDLEIILQGEGVRVDLKGSINISRRGITSSAFANVPDVPIIELRAAAARRPVLGIDDQWRSVRQAADDAHHHHRAERAAPRAHHQDRGWGLPQDKDERP